MEGKKLGKNELLELVKKICNAELETPEEYDDAIYLFNLNCIHPDGSNLIFYQEPELTPEEIVDKALSYKPIIMPSPSDE